MLTSGLTSAPLTKYLLIYIVASSIALSLFDSKHLVHIQVAPHLWTYGQWWRAVVWQIGAGYANSTEVLFGAMLIYQLRVVERMWGTRKLLTFLILTLPYTTLFPPMLLALIVRPLSFNTLNVLPSGPTAIIFAILAQYYAAVPHTFRYRISSATTPVTSGTTSHSPSQETTEANNTNENNNNTNKDSASDNSPSNPSVSLLLSDKSTTYLVALQLSLSQFPNMILPAVVGWIVGLAWRADLVPGSGTGTGSGWRVPAWMVGEEETRRTRTRASNTRDAAGGSRSDGGSTAATATATASGSGTERFEDLRRRLEGEAAAAASAAAASSASGVGHDEPLQSSSGGGRLRRQGQDGTGGFMDRLRGAF